MINPDKYWKEQHDHVAHSKLKSKISHPTIIGVLGSDGKIDYKERNDLPTQLVANDFSVQSLLLTAPEMLKSVPLLDGNNVRQMDNVEQALQDMSNLQASASNESE